MKRRLVHLFRPVADSALSLPGVQLGTRYDGAPVLKNDGRFMAALATHPSAEPQSLVVKMNADDRQWLLDEAPDTYYVTDYYCRYPVVLVRLAQVDRDALRDLLKTAWRITSKKERSEM
jgi:hypothetical protein